MSFFYSTDDDDPKRAARRPMLAFVLIALVVGAVGSVFSEPSLRGWYAGLTQPWFAPPHWIFAWVWTALYIIMGIAASRVWRVTGTLSLEMAIYVLQLLLNLGWVLIFFGLHRTGAAFAEILFLDAAVLLTALLFFRRDRLAGWLFLPYLGWSLFASLLAYAIWSLNA